MSEPRKCAGETKKGEPCKAPPLTDSDFCLAHSDEEARQSAGFGGSQAGAGRPPLPKPTEVARRLIEENVHRILRPHFRTLGLDITDDGQIEVLDKGAVIFGESKDGDVVKSTYEDLGAQIAAAEKLLDRVYGRPKQQTEITGEGGGPVEIASIAPDPERSKTIAQLLSDQGAVEPPT